MNCHEFKKNIDLMLDDELNPDQSTQFNNHLSHCKLCAQEYHHLKQVVAMVSRLEMVPVPVGFQDRVLAQVKIPFRHRARVWLRKKNMELVFRPVAVGMALIITYSLLNSYQAIFKYVSGLVTFKNFYTTLLEASALKQIGFFISDLYYAFCGLINVVLKAFETIFLFLQILATLTPSLPYILPVTIIITLLWIYTLNYSLHSKWRLEYVN